MVEALLLADDPRIRTWLSECLGEQATILPADHDQPDEFIAELNSTPGVGLAFVQFDEVNARARAALVERVVAAVPEVPVIAVGEREAANAVLAAMRAGARDFLVMQRDDANLGDLVSRVLDRSPRSAANRSGQGRLFSVVSAAPDPGVAFLATHLALALQNRGGDTARVLLVDLTMPGGAVLVFLDTEQNYGVLDALADVYRCDQTLIDTAFTRYNGGLFLLALPEDSVGPTSVDADDLGRLADSLLQYFDYIVVAADGVLGLAPVGALVSRATKSLLLTDQSVLRSRQNKHLLHALRQSDCALDAVGLAIQQSQPRLGLEPERLAALLDLPLVATLSGRPGVLVEAMNAGESMFEHAPKDAYTREVLALVERLTGEAATATKGRLLGRLFR